MKFLVDECLSPVLVDEAHAAGFEAYHVAHRGWSSLKDPQLYRRILEADLILVTNNRDDFLHLIGREERNPGLIVILENVRRGEQVELFRAALEALTGMTDMINKVMEVARDGSLTVYELPREPCRIGLTTYCGRTSAVWARLSASGSGIRDASARSKRLPDMARS